MYHPWEIFCEGTLSCIGFQNFNRTCESSSFTNGSWWTALVRRANRIALVACSNVAFAASSAILRILAIEPPRGIIEPGCPAGCGRRDHWEVSSSSTPQLPRRSVLSAHRGAAALTGSLEGNPSRQPAPAGGSPRWMSPAPAGLHISYAGAGPVQEPRVFSVDSQAPVYSEFSE